jgi:hypothetical protein
MKKSDDDLLRPTLDRRFDTSRVGVGAAGRPWNPASLQFVTFFAWPIGAGALYGLNYKRLGQKRAARFTFAGTAVFTLVVLAAMYALFVSAGNDADRTNVRLLRLGFLAVALVGAVLLSKHQSGPYRAYELGSGKSQSLWVAGIVAVLINALVLAALMVAVFALATFAHVSR